jgi:dTDP-4-dehydrorhamnose 3,5-epimerase-like enzyme
MVEEKIHFERLEKHETKNTLDQHVNGSLTVIWRDWDAKFNIVPKMIYATSVNPGEVKGPHLHTKRDSYFVCIRGKVLFVIRDLKEKYHEIESSEDNPVLIQVPKNYASAHINLSNEISTVLTIANLAWRPNDQEMKNISFTNYDWKKWIKNEQPNN